jgi:membrane protease YdiL (CAAX protease family)
MRAMLLVSLSFSCILIYQMMAKSSKLGWLMPSAEHGDTAQTAWLVAILISVFVFAIPALVYANVFPQERFSYFRINRRVSPVAVLLGIIVMILLIFPMDQAAQWIQNSITNKELKDLVDAMDKDAAWTFQMPTFGSFLFCLFANAFVPALCEELLFRGGIQQILMERTRLWMLGTWLYDKKMIKHSSIFITALIFTFFHSNPIAIPFIFLAGLILGYAFYWTGSLRITILMHFCFNGFSIFLDYLGQHNPAVSEWQPGIIVNAIATLGAVLFFFLLWKKTAATRFN